jgi:DHA3 family macrolide efflux protein-like MFS transporter
VYKRQLKEFAAAEFLYGIMESLTTLGSLIGVGLIMYLAHRKEAGAVKPLLLGMVFQSVALLFLGFPAIYFLISAVLIVGFGGELLNVSADSLFQKYIPLESLGTMRGVFDALATLVIPLSQLAFAWMIERSGEIQNLVVMAFFVAVISSLFLREVLGEAKA